MNIVKNVCQEKYQQENAMRCNNRDDLLQLRFTLKIPIFSEVCMQPSRTSMMKT